MVDGFAVPELLEYRWYLVRAVGGDQDIYGLAEYLFRGVAIHLLCAPIPVGDDALQRFCDYGVL